MIAGYALGERLHQSNGVLVSRGVRSLDGLAVVIKSLLTDTATHHDRVRLRYEYRLLQQAHENGVPHVQEPVEFIDRDAEVALITRDIGGLALSHLPAQSLQLVDILQIGEHVARALEGLHRIRIVHKDVTPNNIVYNGQTHAVQLIDFGISSLIALELQAVDNLQSLEGTLPYMSPEQTGRMNRLLDYRSDFYSLGATLYDLIAGAPPFGGDDVTKVVHAILAVVPPQLKAVPEPLALLVAKLLQKDPQDRYLSGHGLAHDLATCRESLQRQGTIPPFTLGQEDRSETFTVAARLYGRETDVATLRASFERVARGRREMVLLSGPSGIGKSALVGELQAAMLAHDSLFLSGKYDQLRRHVPFNAFSQAIAGLVRRLLTEPDASLKAWRRRIEEALGNAGQALVDVAPSLELLVGPQKPVPELGPQETENRLLMLLQRLVLNLCQKHPLVLFLDDLQWADSGTLKLLRALSLDDSRSAGFLFIGAYRSDEVAPDHPLQRLREDVIKSSMPLAEMTVSAMDAASITALVADTCRVDIVEATPLARLVQSKTAGNPFFVREFLTHLWRKDLLQYDPQRGRWTWELQEISQAGVTDNVVSLMAETLTSLSPDEAMTISWAACLGNEFSLNTLCQVRQQPRPTVVAWLAASVAQGLLLPLASAHRFAEDTEEDVRYKFAHDRVQQAAYERLSTLDAQRCHLTIGRQLLSRADRAHPEQWVFGVADHLMTARPLLRNASEQLELAGILLDAGKEAKRAAAYASALTYLHEGLEALPLDAWHSNYALRRQISLETADAEFLSGHVAAATEQIEDTLAHAQTRIERAEVQRRRALCLTALTQFSGALDAGIAGLADLGFVLPRNPAKKDMLLSLMRLEMALRRRPIEQIPSLPPMKDERMQAISRILSDMVTAAYFTSVPLFAVITTTLGRVMLQHGLGPCSAYACGTLVCIYSQLSKFGRARRFAVAAHALLNQRSDAVYAESTLYYGHAFVEFARMPPRDQEDFADDLYERCQENGNPLYVGITGFSNLRGIAMVSTEACLEKLDKYNGFMVSHGTAQLHSWLRSMRQLCRCLQGRTQSPDSYTDDAYNQDAEEAAIKSGKLGSAGQMYHYSRTIALWTHRALPQAADAVMSAAAASVFDRSAAQTLAPFSLFAGLALLQSGRAKPGTPEAKVLQRCVAKLRAVAEEGPSVYGGLPRILEAEIAARAGNPLAGQMFEEAAEAISRSGFPSFCAVAFECAGRYFAEHEFHVRARSYIGQACDAYNSWGARVKVRHLEAEFPRYVSTRRVTTHRSGRHSSSESATTTVASGTYEEVDLLAIMRVSQALSAEVTLEGLLSKVLQSVRENAGATRAVLLLLESNELVVKADSEHQGGLPLEILQYVARSQQELLLDEADRGDFARDPYIAAVHPKSIVCAPIMHHGKIKGVLYLENTLASGSFTTHHLTLVKLMASQAAVSLENVRAYSQMEHLVAERSKQLQTAHEQLVHLERNTTESRMAGGFAHEMRNALGGARYALAAAYPIDGGNRSTLTGELNQDLQALTQLTRTQPAPDDWQTRVEPVLRRLQSSMEATADVFQTIAAGVDRGLNISKQILDYAEVGEMQAGDHAVQMQPMIDAMLAEFEGEFARQNIQVRSEGTQGVVLGVRPEHAYAILHNLLSNARDALSETSGPQRSIFIRAARRSNQVVVEVEDNGMGMDESTQKRVFQPFFTTKGTRGTGLGLGLSRKLAHVYGGDIEFTSRQREGTKFSVLLPSGES